MYKNYSLILAIVMALLPFAARAQQSLTVADGTLLTSEYSNYNFGYYSDDATVTQMVYPSWMLSELGGRSITSLTLYMSESFLVQLQGIVVKLYEVMDTVAGPSGIDFSDATTVFEGSIIGADNQVVFAFDEPYTYGGGNLLVTIVTEGWSDDYWDEPQFYGISKIDAFYTVDYYSGFEYSDYFDDVTEDVLLKATFEYTDGDAFFCGKPGAITVNSVSTEGFEVSWLSVEGVSQYIVYLNGEEVETTSDTTYIFEGLAAGTQYTVGVASDCGGDVVSGMRTTSVQTECGVSTIPWIPELVDASSLQCWTIVDANNDGSTWRVVPTQSALYEPYTDVSDDWAISQLIEIPEGETNVFLKWEDYLTNFNIDTYYEVLVSPEGGVALGDFTDTVFSVQEDNGGLWVERSVDFTQYAGSTIRIAFHHGVNDDDNGLGIRNISLRNTYAPLVTIEGQNQVNIGTTVQLVAHLIEGSADDINFQWTSTMEEANLATMNIEDDTVANITYGTEDGVDTVTLVVTNASGSAAFTYMVRVIDYAPVSEFPYSTGFEADDDCANWLFVNNGVNGWYIGSLGSHTGEGGMYVSSNGGASRSYNTNSASVNFAYRYVNFENEGEYALTFDWSCNGEENWDFLRAFVVPESFDLGSIYYDSIGSDYLFEGAIAADGGFQAVDSYTWQMRQGSFIIATPGLYKLVFAWCNDDNAGNSPAGAVDNVMLQVLTCHRPTDISIREIAAHSATITWPTIGDESEWELVVGEERMIVSDTMYEATELAGGEEIVVTVRAICGEGDTSLYQTTSFYTFCDAIDVPYTEDFDSYSSTYNDVHISCWMPIGLGHITITASSVTGTALRFYPENTVTDATLAVLPTFTTATNELRLSFMSRPESSSYSGSISVGYITDVSDLSTYVEVFSQDAASVNETYANISVTFPDAPEDAHIAIAYTPLASYTNYYWYVDNVEVTLAGDDPEPQPDVCNVPTNVHSTAATTSSITLDWGGTAASWKVSVNNGADQAVSSHPYTITGLAAGTAYSIRVKAVCADGQESSYSTAISVSTEEEGTEPQPEVCEVPTNVHSTAATTSSITLDWGGTAASWKVSVDGGADQAVSSHPYTLTGLMAGTTYSIRVKAVCDSGQESDYCAAISVSTEAEQPVGIDGVAYTALNLYPNPASGAVSISGIEAGAQVSIVDINGRTLCTLTAQSSTMEMSLEGLATGTYFVRIAGAEGTATSRLVVR